MRKVVKLFKRSPVRNDNLQYYVKSEDKKKLTLLLDSKTRWSTLLTMFERFHRLKNSIRKSLIDLDLHIEFSDE